MKVSDLFEPEHVEKGKDDEYSMGRGLLPDIDFNDKENKRVSNVTQVNSLQKIFAHCFFHPPRNIARDVMVYGEIFFKHYEIEQRIKDSFHQIGPENIGLIEDIYHTANFIYKSQEDYFSKRPRPTFMGEQNGKSSESPFLHYLLSEHDAYSRQPRLYSELFCNMLNKDIKQHRFSKLKVTQKPTHKNSILASPKHYSVLLDSSIDLGVVLEKDEPVICELMNFDITNEIVDSIINRVLKAYIAKLVQKCTDDVLKQLILGNRYESRIKVSTVKEAVTDYKILRRLHNDSMEPGQHVYLIDLQYYKGTITDKVKGLRFDKVSGKKTSKNKYNHLMKEYKKIDGISA